MSPVVFDTKNMNSLQRLDLDLGNLINCKDNEHYEQVKTTYRIDSQRKHQMKISDN